MKLEHSGSGLRVAGAILALSVLSCGGGSSGKAPPAPHQNITPPYECLACHAQGTTSNAPKVGASHAGRTNDQCMGCHAPGGGGGGGTCEACLGAKCQAQVAACNANQQCVQLFQCLGGCAANDQTCVNNCAAQFQGGVTAANTLLQCAQQNCQAQCK